VPRNRTRADRALHPRWCAFAYDGCDDHHDPHTSRRALNRLIGLGAITLVPSTNKLTTTEQEPG
jgi:hypothetical protein